MTCGVTQEHHDADRDPPARNVERALDESDSLTSGSSVLETVQKAPAMFWTLHTGDGFHAEPRAE